MATQSGIPVPPTTIDWPPLGGRWFHWSVVEAAFWNGNRRAGQDESADLDSIRDRGGVYVLAWSVEEPERDRPHTERSVKYIDETSYFKGRLGAFGTSAGFWDERANGHSAGWSWEKGRSENLWVAFFGLPGGELPAHLATGLRKWIEALALEEYRSRWGPLPVVNVLKRNVVVNLAD